MSRILVKILNSKSFHTTVFYMVVMGWLACLSVFAHQTNTSLLQIQAGIAERLKYRYSSIDAAKDNRVQNLRINNLERKVDFLEAEAKAKARYK